MSTKLYERQKTIIFIGLGWIHVVYIHFLAFSRGFKDFKLGFICWLKTRYSEPVVEWNACKPIAMTKIVKLKENPLGYQEPDFVDNRIIISNNL